MTYTIKEKNKMFYLYNTNTRRMMTKGYKSVIEAKTAVSSVNTRGQGLRKYHACCRKAGCGKKNKKKAVQNKLPTRRTPSKAVQNKLPKRKTTKKAVQNKLPKRKTTKKAVQNKLPTRRTPSKAVKNTLPIRKKKKRRVALTQVVNNSGSGNIKLTKGSGQGQRKAYKFMASDQFEKRYKRLDKHIKHIAFSI